LHGIGLDFKYGIVEEIDIIPRREKILPQLLVTDLARGDETGQN
jgi:hypothetical protein